MLRIALITASIANLAAGLGLGGLWFKFRHDPGMPIVVLFIGLSLLIQGGFTLGHLRGIWKHWGLRRSRYSSRAKARRHSSERSPPCREFFTIFNRPTAIMSGVR